MIPHRIHFIFGLDPAFGGKPFSFVHYLAVRSAAVLNPADEIVFHYAYMPAGRWWDAAQPYFISNRISPPSQTFGRRLAHYAHKADVLRLELLKHEGGVYLDSDVLCVRSFDSLRGYPAVMGIEPNAGLCNAVILAERNSEFIADWLSSYHSFDAARWNHHSVVRPYEIALRKPCCVHVEWEYSFFFPTYDDPMYQWLWCESLSLAHRFSEIARVMQDCPYYFRSGGPIRVVGYLRHASATREWYYRRLRKSYCIHLWQSLWWEPFLRALDPHTLRESKGLFARIVAEILPDLEP